MRLVPVKPEESLGSCKNLLPCCIKFFIRGISSLMQSSILDSIGNSLLKWIISLLFGNKKNFSDKYRAHNSDFCFSCYHPNIYFIESIKLLDLLESFAVFITTVVVINRCCSLILSFLVRKRLKIPQLDCSNFLPFLDNGNAIIVSTVFALKQTPMWNTCIRY